MLWTKWLSILAIVVVATVVNATIVGLNMNWAYKKRPRVVRGEFGANCGSTSRRWNQFARSFSGAFRLLSVCSPVLV